MLTYISILISTIGASLGLIGQSINPEKRGLKRLTSVGRVAACMIILGTGVSLHKTYLEKSIHDFQTRQIERVREIVYSKIYYSCYHLANPIIAFYSQVDPDSKSEMKNTDIWIQLVDESTIQILKSSNLAVSVESDSGFEKWNESYIEYFDGYYNGYTSQSLENVLNQWAIYIDPQDLVLMDSLSDHAYLEHLRYIKPYNNEDEKLEFVEKVGVYYFFDDEDVLAEHQDFFTMLGKLCRKSAKYHGK
ncbi:MAG: hypothetical protein AAF363_09040 [Bacteroidota bacterium]